MPDECVRVLLYFFFYNMTVTTPARVGKKMVSAWVDPHVSMRLKQIALDNNTTVQALFGEAINDLFEKYDSSGRPTLGHVANIVAQLTALSQNHAAEMAAIAVELEKTVRL